MKRNIVISLLIVTFMTSLNAQTVRRLGNSWDWQNREDSLQNYAEPTYTQTSKLRHDTIIVEEIIKRTDVIHRTEEIIKRVESSPSGYKGPVNVPLDIMDAIGFNEKENTNVPQVEISESDTEPNEIDYNPEFSNAYPAYTPPGGTYIWVPDSMENKVSGLLNGESLTLSNKSEEEVDKSELVTFRGKTLPMVLKSRNLGRYDRGLFNFLFIPKGIWQLGLTASYGEFSTENLQILDLVSDIDFKGKIFSVRPYFSYFFKSNLSLGLRLGYTRGEASIGAFNVDIDEDMSFNLHDIMYKSASYSAAVTFTQYLGIARRGRFAVFNEVELAFAGGDSDFNRPFNGEMRKTHTQTFELGLNFSPGVCVYIIDPLSFNVSLGVFGLNIKHEKQKVNDEDLGWRTTSGANFRFNIFNINFGIAVNI